MSTKNFRTQQDGADSLIDSTGEEPNGIDVFAVFSDAQDSLISELKSEVEGLNQMINEIQRLDESDID